LQVAASEIGNPCVPRGDVHSQGSAKLYGAEKIVCGKVPQEPHPVILYQNLSKYIARALSQGDFDALKALLEGGYWPVSLLGLSAPCLRLVYPTYEYHVRLISDGIVHQNHHH